MDFKPYTKKEQLKGHQKDLDTPKLVNKRPNKRKPKKNTNVEMFHNRKIPHWKQRGEVKRKEAVKVLNHYGEECAVCGNHNYALHHIKHKGYGIGGRGTWRNLVPLCEAHHTGQEGVHTIKTFDDFWKDKHHEKFGPYFFCDRWDLWMKGIIESPTEELFEKRMLLEEEKARETVREGNNRVDER